MKEVIGMYNEFDPNKKKYDNYFYSVKDGELDIQLGCFSFKGKTMLQEEQIPMYLERIGENQDIDNFISNYDKIEKEIESIYDVQKRQKTWDKKVGSYDLFSRTFKKTEDKINELGREYDIFGKQFFKILGDSFDRTVEWDKFSGFQPHKMKGVIELGNLYFESNALVKADKSLKNMGIETQLISDLKVKNGMNGQLIGFIYNGTEGYAEGNNLLFVIDPLSKDMSLKGFNLTRSLNNVWQTRKGVIFKDKEGIFATIEGRYEEIMEKTTLKVRPLAEDGSVRICNGDNWVELFQPKKFTDDIGDKFLKFESRCTGFNYGFKEMKEMLADVTRRSMLPDNVRERKIGIDEAYDELETKGIINKLSPKLEKARMNAHLLSEIFKDDSIYTFKPVVSERYGVKLTQGTEVEISGLAYQLHNGFSLKYENCEIKGRTPYGVKISEDLITKYVAESMKLASKSDWKKDEQIRSEIIMKLQTVCPEITIKNVVNKEKGMKR